MGLQLRRGTNAERLQITPLQGELVYTTDTKAVYVGDGQTIGGLAVTVFTSEDAQDAVEALFSNGTHSGITFDYNDVTNSISATVTSSLTSLTDTGIVDPQVGQVLKYNGTSWVNGSDIDTDTGILSVSEDTTPQLGGNLDLNNKNITGIGNIDISGNVSASSVITNTISGSTDFVTIESSQKPALRIKSVTDGTLVGLPFLEIYVSNGTLLSPTDTLAGDLLTGIKFTAYNEATTKFAGSITSQWDSAATMTNDFPGSILTFSAGDNNTGFKSATFTGVTGAFAAPVLQTGVYTTTPDTRPANPSKGMIIFNDTAGQFEGWNGTAWVTLG